MGRAIARRGRASPARTNAAPNSLRRQLAEVGLAIVARVLLRDRVHAGERRAVAAALDHRGDGVARADEQRLDRAVTAVAHPAAQGPADRLVAGPGAVADALHAAADAHTHRNSHRAAPSKSA